MKVLPLRAFNAPTSVSIESHAYVQLFDHNGEEVSFFPAGDSLRNTGGTDVLRTEDGGYLIGGEIVLPLPGSQRYYFTKISASGTQLWQQIYPDFYEKSVLMDIMPADNGNFYALGHINFDSGDETGDVYLMKLDSLANMLWDTVYNPGTTDQVIDAKRTNDGGMIIVGGMDVDVGFAMKLKPNFEVDWVAEDVLSICGPDGISENDDGSFVICGCYYPPDADYADMGIIKLSPSGEKLWHRRYGGPYHDYGYDMTATPDGGYIVCGRTDTLIAELSTFYADVYLVKTNCMGFAHRAGSGFQLRSR